MDEDKSVEFKGEPYFIRQIESGIYCAIRKISLNELVSDVKQQWIIEDDESIGRLTLGVDIEDEKIGIPIVAHIPKDDFIAPSIIQACRKFAIYGKRKYVGLDDKLSADYDLTARDEADSQIEIVLVPIIYRQISKKQ